MEHSPNPYQTPQHSEALNSNVTGTLTSQYGSYRSAKVISKILIVCLILQGISTISYTFVYYLFYQSALSNNLTSINQLSHLLQLVAAVVLIIMIVTIIMFCIWTNRSMKNTWALNQFTSQLIKPGWAVGWYFIPIISLWKPIEAVQQMRNACSPSLKHFSLAPWWTFWIVSNIIDRISAKLPADTVEQIKGSFTFDVISTCVNLGACIFAILMVKKITTGLDLAAEEATQ